MKSHKARCCSVVTLLAFYVVFMLVGCDSNSLGSGEQKHPVLTLQLPDNLPVNGERIEYDLLIKVDNQVSKKKYTIYALINSAIQVRNGMFRVDLAPGELGTAVFELHPLNASKCSEYVSLGNVTIDKNEILPVVKIADFQKTTETCLLRVSHRAGDDYTIGYVASTGVNTGTDPAIACGLSCFAHVGKGTQVNFIATGNADYSFRNDWRINESPVKNPVTINGPTTVVAVLTPNSCKSPGFCPFEVSFFDSKGQMRSAPTSLSIEDIWGNSDDDIWAVGKDAAEGGAVLHYSAGSWFGITADTIAMAKPVFHGVWASVGNKTAWVVGENKSIYTCTLNPANVPVCKSEVVTVSGNPAFFSVAGQGDTLWVRDAGSVSYATQIAPGAGINLSSSMIVPSPNSGLQRMAAVDNTAMYIVGQGGNAQRCSTSGTCSRISPFCDTKNYVGVYSAAGSILAVGEQGAACLYNGSTATSEGSTAGAIPTLRDVFITATNQAWAVGDISGGAHVEYWTLGKRSGAQTLKFDTLVSTLRAVYVSKTDVWLGGDSGLQRYRL